MYSHRNSDISNLFSDIFEHSKTIKPLQGDNYKIPFYNDIEIISNSYQKNNITDFKNKKNEEIKKEEEKKEEEKKEEKKEEEIIKESPKPIEKK